MLLAKLIRAKSKNQLKTNFVLKRKFAQIMQYLTKMCQIVTWFMMLLA